MQPLSLDWRFLWLCFEKIGIAWILVFPAGWWSEKQGNFVGIRTFPLVAMASCGYVLLADKAAGGDATTRSHIIQGLTTGIGFIGGGAIMRSRGNVHGTATAASIWNTGVIGAAVAESRFEIAVILSLLNLITLHLLVPRRERAGHAGQAAPK